MNKNISRIRGTDYLCPPPSPLKGVLNLQSDTLICSRETSREKKHRTSILCCQMIKKSNWFGEETSKQLKSLLASGYFYRLLISFANTWASWNGAKPFDTLIEFLKDYYEKFNFEKKSKDEVAKYICKKRKKRDSMLFNY